MRLELASGGNRCASLVHFNSIKVRLEPRKTLTAKLKVLYFNSIKVRLERGYHQGYSRCRVGFQFHKGAIRTSNPNSSGFDSLDFNSIKVRLEPPEGSALTNDVIFQFHKGAIRTERNQIMQLLQDKFQFHKGAIRTGADFTEFDFDHNFNSIKVRLERFSPSSIAFCCSISIP